MDIGKPYTEICHSDHIIREFSPNTQQYELSWHQDQFDRIVLVLSGNSWKLQMDNEIPQNLVPGEKYYIPKNTYHRLIKGPNILIIKIFEIFVKF